MGMQRKVRSKTKRDSAQPGDTGKNMLEGRECTEIIESDQFVTFVNRGRGDGAVGKNTTVRPPDGGHMGGGSNPANAIFFFPASGRPLKRLNLKVR